MRIGAFYRFRNGFYIESKIIVIISIIVIVGVIIFFPRFITNTYNVTVTNKKIINRNNTDKFLIYTQTEDGELKVFEDYNDFLALKFNSEDLYWAIEIDRKYEIKASGVSIPILLHYQNILKVKVIDK